ncbi:hypothetical protein HDU83_003126 [Entophlyctis luteolus]|nr:hypothetical protein HDU83_003126 [Entophlyctis luteolus]
MEENTTPAIKELQEHLGTKARIQATDGRVFTGVFMCIDKYRNVVLTGAEEFREGADGRDLHIPGPDDPNQSSLVASYPLDTNRTPVCAANLQLDASVSSVMDAIRRTSKALRDADCSTKKANSSINLLRLLNMQIHPFVERLLNLGPASSSGDAIHTQSQHEIVDAMYMCLLEFFSSSPSPLPSGLFSSRLKYMISICASANIGRIDLAHILLTRAIEDPPIAKHLSCAPFKTLIAEYCRLGRTDDALKVSGLLEMSQLISSPDVYYPIIRSLTNVQDLPLATKLFESILNKFSPEMVDSSIYNHIIKLCLEANTPSSQRSAERTLELLFSKGRPCATTFSILFSRAESIEAVDTLVTNMAQNAQFKNFLFLESVQNAIIRRAIKILCPKREKPVEADESMQQRKRTALRTCLEYTANIQRLYFQKQHQKHAQQTAGRSLFSPIAVAPAVTIARLMLPLKDLQGILRILEPLILSVPHRGDVRQIWRFFEWGAERVSGDDAWLLLRQWSLHKMAFKSTRSDIISVIEAVGRSGKIEDVELLYQDLVALQARSAEETRVFPAQMSRAEWVALTGNVESDAITRVSVTAALIKAVHTASGSLESVLVRTIVGGYLDSNKDAAPETLMTELLGEVKCMLRVGKRTGMCVEEWEQQHKKSLVKAAVEAVRLVLQ